MGNFYYMYKLVMWVLNFGRKFWSMLLGSKGASKMLSLLFLLTHVRQHSSKCCLNDL